MFRCPILAKNIKPAVRYWKKPIVIGRHAYGDLYRDVEMCIPAPGTVNMIYTPADGGPPQCLAVHDFQGPGVVLGMHNLSDSIKSFAQACFRYALDKKLNMMFSTKDTISKTYDGEFKRIFHEVFEHEFKERFTDAGISYSITLINDAVARIMKSEGGLLWACRNYDGDVMSDMIASAFGSLAMMTSELVSPHGYYEYEAAHGTVQRHYYQHLKGEKTSTNSTALIYAWTGALSKRGELDDTPEVVEFANKLELAVIATIESGLMTKDLLSSADPKPERAVATAEFIDAVAKNLEKRL